MQAKLSETDNRSARWDAAYSNVIQFIWNFYKLIKLARNNRFFFNWSWPFNAAL